MFEEKLCATDVPEAADGFFSFSTFSKSLKRRSVLATVIFLSGILEGLPLVVELEEEEEVVVLVGTGPLATGRLSSLSPLGGVMGLMSERSFI